MRDITLRKQKDEWLTPFVTHTMGHVHPNYISVVAMLVGLVAAVAITNRLYLIGLGFWLFNRVLDGLDGLVARVHHKQSDFGGYLDLLLDFIVYLAVPIAFLIAEPTSINLWAGIGLLACYTLNTISWTTLSALIEKRRNTTLHNRFDNLTVHKNFVGAPDKSFVGDDITSKRLTSMEMPTGLIEGAETILFYSLFCLIPWLLAPLFALMSLLVLFTACQRVVWAYKNLV